MANNNENQKSTYVIELTKRELAKVKSQANKTIRITPINTWVQKVLDHRQYVLGMNISTVHKIIDFTLARIGMKMDYSKTEGLTFKVTDMNKGQFDALKGTIENIQVRNNKSARSIDPTEHVGVKADIENNIPNASKVKNVK